MRRLHGSLGALLATTLLVDCTFLALDEFSLPRCTTNAQCEGLNTDSGIGPEVCVRYQCAPADHLCRLMPLDRDGDGDPDPRCDPDRGMDCDDRDPRRAGNMAIARAICGGAGTECCDGVDNDCDNVVDEGAWRRGEARSVSAGLTSPATLTSARGVDGTFALLSTNVSSMASFGVLDGAALQQTSLTFSAEIAVDTRPTVFANRCPVSVAGRQDHEGCAFADLAAASVGSTIAGPSTWFALAINPNACRAGQVRAGWFQQTAGDVSPVLLSAVRSPLAFGVDLMGACTGASRRPAREGASRVAVAAWTPDASNPRALGAWIGRAPAAMGCGAPAPVEILGLSLFLVPELVAGRRVVDLRGTDGNLPRHLGDTIGDGRPAVVAVPAAGVFAVAYGAEDGVRVHTVDDFGAPESTLGGARAPFVLTGTGTSRANEVAISVGANSAAGFDLGVAWREGCDASGALRFALVRVNAAMPATSSATAPVEVATDASLPAITWVPSGVLARPSMRGTTAVTEANDGGWVIAYVAREQAFGRRASELDGSLIAEEPLLLGDAREGTRGVRLELRAESSAGQVLALTHDGRGAGALSSVELACRVGR